MNMFLVSFWNGLIVVLLGTSQAAGMMEDEAFATCYVDEQSAQSARPSKRAYHRIPTISAPSSRLKLVVQQAVPSNWLFVAIWKHSTINSYLVAREQYEPRYRFQWVICDANGKITEDTEGAFPDLEWKITGETLGKMHANYLETNNRIKQLITNQKALISWQKDSKPVDLQNILDDNKAVKVALEKTSREVIQLKRELSESKNQNVQLSNRVFDIQNEKKVIHSDCEQSKEQVVQLGAQLSDAKDQNTQISQRVFEIENERDSALTQREEIQEELTESQQEVVRLESAQRSWSHAVGFL